MCVCACAAEWVGKQTYTLGTHFLRLLHIPNINENKGTLLERSHA